MPGHSNVNQPTPESALYRSAKDALFRAQLAEIRELAEDSFRALAIPIGNMMVGQCTRCGAPVGYGEDRVYRTADCERECAS